MRFDFWDEVCARNQPRLQRCPRERPGNLQIWRCDQYDGEFGGRFHCLIVAADIRRLIFLECESVFAPCRKGQRLRRLQVSADAQENSRGLVQYEPCHKMDSALCHP